VGLVDNTSRSLWRKSRGTTRQVHEPPLMNGEQHGGLGFTLLPWREMASVTSTEVAGNFSKKMYAGSTTGLKAGTQDFLLAGLSHSRLLLA